MTGRSPVPGAGLAGYTDERSVAPGETIAFMAGGPAGKACARLVRLVHGDPNPDGPGAREQEAAWWPPRELAIEPRALALGSYVEVADPTLLNDLRDGFTIALWFKPTLLRGGWHALASKWAPDELAAGMFVAGDGILTAAVSHDGATTTWVSTPPFVHAGRWQFAALVHNVGDGGGALTLHHGFDPGALASRSVALPPGPIAQSVAPFRLGACGDPDGAAHAWGHFNGRIAHPVVLGSALERDAVAALARGAEPACLGPVHARWDLGRDVEGTHVADASGARRDGVAVNAPARAVTGPHFSGTPMTLFGEQDQDYGAIHLHDDDLDDAGWPATATATVPADAEPGIYALRLKRRGDSLALPFVVRPARARHPLAFLVPTFTWQAYGSNSQPWSYTDDGVLDAGVCLYNVHSDGSPVYYASRRRPTRSGDPASGFAQWGAHNITANLYLVDWLEERGVAYDTYADEDLDRNGAALLEPYRCLLLGSHPEYWTEAMMDALEAYLDGGGRVLYLGGNGLFWVTSIDPARPHLLEVRKERGAWPADFPNSVAEVADGERRHSTTLEIGGTWRSRGRPTSALVGVEYVADDFMAPRSGRRFERMPAAADPRVAWVFDGVGHALGATGLNLGSAAGFELDGAPDRPGGPPGAVDHLLARAAHPAFEPAAFAARPAVADVVLRVLPNGGAVFSAGSVTWTGSLSADGYEGGVGRMTENVLRRFLTVEDGRSVTA